MLVVWGVGGRRATGCMPGACSGEGSGREGSGRRTGARVNRPRVSTADTSSGTRGFIGDGLVPILASFCRCPMKLWRGNVADYRHILPSPDVARIWLWSAAVEGSHIDGGRPLLTSFPGSVEPQAGLCDVRVVCGAAAGPGGYGCAPVRRSHLHPSFAARGGRAGAVRWVPGWSILLWCLICSGWSISLPLVDLASRGSVLPREGRSCLGGSVSPRVVDLASEGRSRWEWVGRALDAATGSVADSGPIKNGDISCGDRRWHPKGVRPKDVWAFGGPERVPDPPNVQSPFARLGPRYPLQGGEATKRSYRSAFGPGGAPPTRRRASTCGVRQSAAHVRPPPSSFGAFAGGG